jgi:hypothetical protein
LRVALKDAHWSALYREPMTRDFASSSSNRCRCLWCGPSRTSTDPRLPASPEPWPGPWTPPKGSSRARTSRRRGLVLSRASNPISRPSTRFHSTLSSTNPVLPCITNLTNPGVTTLRAVVREVCRTATTHESDQGDLGGVCHDLLFVLPMLVQIEAGDHAPELDEGPRRFMPGPRLVEDLPSRRRFSSRRAFPGDAPAEDVNGDGGLGSHAISA